MPFEGLKNGFKTFNVIIINGLRRLGLTFRVPQRDERHPYLRIFLWLGLDLVRTALTFDFRKYLNGYDIVI